MVRDNLHRLGLICISLGTILFFQNCSDPVMSFSQTSVKDIFGSVECVNFEVDGSGNCLDSQYGLVGDLYYLKAHIDFEGKVQRFQDRFNVDYASLQSSDFPNVQSIIDKGFRHDALVLMPQVNMPTMKFSNGFSMGSGQFLKDKDGDKLFEAFALDLRGFLLLPAGFQPGYYMIGTISDDGSVVEVASQGNANYDVVVNNDNWHSPTLKCSSQAVYMDRNSRLPIRLRYFQGPRDAIAMTLVMKPVSSQTNFEVDQFCGFSDSGKHPITKESGAYFFGKSISTPGYVPDYANGVYGSMLRYGWKSLPKQAFGLPEKTN